MFPQPAETENKFGYPEPVSIWYQDQGRGFGGSHLNKSRSLLETNSWFSMDLGFGTTRFRTRSSFLTVLFTVGAVSPVVQCSSVEAKEGRSTKPETPSSLRFWLFPPRWHRWCQRTQRHPGLPASLPGLAWPGTGTGTGPAKPPGH